MNGSCALVTGFVADSPEEGSIFPSAGGNSAEAGVQAVYWRCIAVLFASARITNPDLRLILFANVAPPVIDGVALASVLKGLGVEVRYAPLTHRLSARDAKSWGNVFYFLDILDAIEAEGAVECIILVDNDVVVSRPLDSLFSLLEQANFAGYVVESGVDECINGMTRTSMTGAAREWSGKALAEPVQHYGGELLGLRVGDWQAYRSSFEGLFDQADKGLGMLGQIRTEEHLFSIAFAASGAQVALANPYIKRIWTSPRHSTVEAGDEDLALWHLPAEKRYGLADLFGDLFRQRFPPSLTPSELRVLAARRCGLPHKSLHKILHDGWRQVAAKLRLRT